MFEWLTRRQAAPAAQRVEPSIMAANRLTGPMELEQALRELGGEGLADSGVMVTPRLAEGLAAVAACVRVLSSAIAQLPLCVYRRLPNGGREPDAGSLEYRLLHDKPNDWQSSYQLRRMLQRDICLRGNGYGLLTRGDGGRVIEILRMHPDRVRPMQDERTLQVTYQYTSPAGRMISLPQENVLHLWNESDDGLIGLSPLAVHRNTFGDGIALQKHGSRFFRNGARPSGALMTDKTMNAQARGDMRADWESLYGGENTGRIAILDMGLKYEPISISNEDAQYLESRKFNRTEVCGIFGVPPHRIAELERATFSNIEHQSLEFVMYDLMPHLVMWEQALGLKVLGSDDGRYVKHTVDALLRGDSKSRAEALQIKRRNGVLSADEWRELDDLNPRGDAGGQGYIIEANMRPDDGSNPNAQQPATGAAA